MSAPNTPSYQFDDVAQCYDSVRPRYPEAMVKHIIASAALPAHSQLFEVGCGTRQMTLPFVQREYAGESCNETSQAILMPSPLLYSFSDGW